MNEEEEAAFKRGLIVVCFYEAKDGDDPAGQDALTQGTWWTRTMLCMVAWLRFRHCEIAFPIDSESLNRIRNAKQRKEAIQAHENDPFQLYAYSVSEGTPVFGKPRSFSLPNYHLLWLKVGPKARDHVQSFCENQVGKPLDAWGPYRSVLWPKQTNGEKWYCVEFVAAAVQQIGLIGYAVNPATISIDELYSTLNNRREKLDRFRPSSPYIALLAYQSSKLNPKQLAMILSRLENTPPGPSRVEQATHRLTQEVLRKMIPPSIPIQMDPYQKPFPVKDSLKRMASVSMTSSSPTPSFHERVVPIHWDNGGGDGGGRKGSSAF